VVDDSLRWGGYAVIDHQLATGISVPRRSRRKDGELASEKDAEWKILQ